MIGKFLGWLIYLGLLGLVLYQGWEHPLHNLFRTAEEIQAIEHPATPRPVMTPRPRSPVPEWKSPLEQKSHL